MTLGIGMTGRMIPVAVLALACLGSPAAAEAADPDPAAILKNVDRALGRWETLRVALTVTTRDSAGQRAVTAERLLRAGSQILRVTSPEDLKGVELRVSGSEPPVLYMPLADSTRSILDLSEPLPGTFLPMGYFLLTGYSDWYVATLISSSPGRTSLRLDARNKTAEPFSRIDLVVDMDRHVPLNLRYFREGKAVLTETRHHYVRAGEGWVPKDSVIRDNGRGNAKVFVRKVEADVDIPELPPGT